MPVMAASAADVATAFDPVAATQAYLDTVAPELRARSDAYFEGGYWLLLWDLVVALLIAWGLMGSGLSRGLRDRCARIWRGRLTVPLYVLGYVLLTGALGLPYKLYRDFFREKSYGLMNQGLGAWLGDWAVSLAVNSVVMVVLLSILYALVRRLGRGWWVWGTGVTTLVMGLLLLAGPVFLAPLFNHYTPLADGPVRSAVLSMARSNGVPATDVYQFDASRQSDRISANVSGLFGTTRVSLTDNLIQQGTLPEIKAVMAHEIGHYVLDHLIAMLIYLTIIVAVGFAFVDWAYRRLASGLGRRWGVEAIGDVAGLPVAVALISLYSFAMTPALNTMVRVHEAQADMFGLNLAREPDAFATVAVKLAQYRKLHPGPVEEFLFYDHPSGYTRILTAMRWKAENMGTPAPADAAPAAPQPATP